MTRYDLDALGKLSFDFPRHVSDQRNSNDGDENDDDAGDDDDDDDDDDHDEQLMSLSKPYLSYLHISNVWNWDVRWMQ